MSKAKPLDAFIEFVNEDPGEALKLLTSMFVHYTLEFVQQNGQDIDPAGEVFIEGGEGRRNITIHAKN